MSPSPTSLEGIERRAAGLQESQPGVRRIIKALVGAPSWNCSSV